MSEGESKAPGEQAKGRKGPGLAVWAALGAVAAGGGFAVPFFLPTADSAAAHATNEPAHAPRAHIPEDLAFVPFGDVTVNLDDGRMSRYLRLKFSVQVEKGDQQTVAHLFEEKRAILQNWLLSHLSDKNMEDIRGAAGQNRLRREIQDQFNTTLFPDGYDRIYEELFQEFNVQ
jgi:flagellar basal body-associated protein FliL